MGEPTFIVHGAVGGDMSPGEFGINNGWAGMRTTSALVSKFDDNDTRGMFFTTGQTLEIENVADFKNGYAITKFSNKNSDGSNGSDAEFVDTDFPMFRLADAYLMYAEAVVRGGSGGDIGTAVGYVNQLRERVYSNSAGYITNADLTLELILDERSRELLWECHRRTDLVRAGQFTDGSYHWPWKGDVPEGTATSDHLNIFPIPAADLAANPELDQNPVY